MKKNNIVDLRSKTQDELSRMLFDLREGVMHIKKDATISKLKNTNSARNTKKDIARVLTFLSMKSVVSEEPKKESSSIKIPASKRGKLEDKGGNQ